MENLCYIHDIMAENVSIHLSSQTARVAIYSPTEWHSGVTKEPSIMLDIYPILHSDTTSFKVVQSKGSELPETAEGLDVTTIIDKTIAAVKAELENEGEVSLADRLKDSSYILSETGGKMQRDYVYKVIAWYVSERPGEISALWLASARSISPEKVSTEEPAGHRYKV